MIISEYCVVLKDRLIRAHRYRVDVADLLIVPAAAWASFESLRLRARDP